ncbi:MAG: alkaline phosphatase family protein [Planctomycetota bacterium]
MVLPLRLLATALLPLVLAAQQGDPAATAPEEPARLLVLVVVDQLIPAELERLEPWLTGGLHRFAAEGEVWRAGAHGHGVTETGPGHATLGTGVHPRRHGIVANEWPNAETRGTTYCAADASVRILTSAGPGEGGGRSPAHLAAPGFADHLKALVPAARCVGVSGKDRAAIFATGRSADWALWWDPQGSGFASSTHYGGELPRWVREWNAAWSERLAREGATGLRWESELPADIARAGTTPDADEGESGLRGRTEFPYEPPPLSAPPTTREIESLAAGYVFFTPFVDAFTVEMAERAVAEMELGADADPDFLLVSLSACDSAGHLFGPGSAEVTDLLLRADRALGELFRLLDERIGAGRWAAALSADHGVLELPERLLARGIPARRTAGTAHGLALRAMRESLAARFGADFYVSGLAGVRLATEQAEAAGIAPADLRRAAADAYAASAGAEVARVFTLDELLAAPAELAADPLLVLMSRSAFAGRSPDIAAVPPWGVLALARGTSHGTPWEYDRRVPIAFLGRGTTKGERFEPCFTVDVLPTLFHRAGLPVPDGLDGRVLE